MPSPAPQPGADATVYPAPMLSRMLAAFIDYLVLTSLGIFSMRFISNPDLLAVPDFVIGALYLGLGASRLSGGQTLGKKAFGIRVVSTGSNGIDPYLSPLTGLFRFFSQIGAVMLLSDLTPILYRKIELVADPRVLELHMWLALSYTISNVALTLLSPTHRGLHDIFSKAIVVRGPAGLPAGSGKIALETAPKTKQFMPPLLGALSFGAIFGTLLWSHGVETAPEINGPVSHRFKLESHYPVRIQGMLKVEPRAVLIAAEVSPAYLKTGDALPESTKLASDITKHLLEQKLIRPEDVSLIHFNFNRIVPSAQTGMSFSVEEVEVDTATLESKLLPAQGF